MKKLSLMLSPKTFFLGIALAFILTTGMSSAQTILIDPTTNDGSFESVISKTDFTPTTSAAATIPFWGSAGGTISDTGAEPGATNTIEQGNVGSFYKPTDGAAFNLVTDYTIHTGDQFTLTWYGQATGGVGSAQIVTLYSQAPGTVGTTWSYVPTATLVTTASNPGAYTLLLAGGTNNFTQYSLTYTATAGDVGNLIGITAGNGNTAGGYISEDNFNLSVLAAPEPNPWALLGLGCVVLIFLARRRRLV